MLPTSSKAGSEICCDDTPNGPHAELWAELAAEVHRRRRLGNKIEVRKVKAHMTDDEVYTYRPSWSDYAGNACADALADRAALQMLVPESWGYQG